MTVEEFTQLVARHDLTYMYSDDARVHRSGAASMRQIREAAEEIGRKNAAKIWNETVDEKLMRPEDRQQFYWKTM